MESENNEHDEISKLLRENRKLLEQNNELLRKLHRHSVWAFISRTIAFSILIGAPVALYYYIIEPYFTSLATGIQSFTGGLQEAPGWSQLMDVVKGRGE